MYVGVPTIAGEARGVLDARESEVRDHDPSGAVYEQIGRFDVAMDDAALVGVREAPGGVAHERHRGSYGLLVATLVLAEVVAVHQLH
jgi:hypothetical protein